MIECVICGRTIKDQKYAIRDYNNENHRQWIWRHIKTIFTGAFKKRNEGQLAVCSQCAWRYTNELLENMK